MLYRIQYCTTVRLMRKSSTSIVESALFIFLIALILLTAVRSSAQVSVNGFIFDDANGNGMIDHTDAAGSLGQTFYAVLSDSTGLIAAVGQVAANGTFSLNNIPSYTSGFKVYVTDSIPSVGTRASTYSWPCGWGSTLGQYGKNNLAGTGINGFTGVSIPVSTGAADITGVMIGFDRLATCSPLAFVIPAPMPGSIRKLLPANGLGALTASDPENGTLGANNTFTINSIAGMNGNKLYYDQNGNGVLEAFEQIIGYTLFTKYDPNKLYIKFTGAGSVSASFTYNAADPAGMLGLSPSTYLISWVSALPVELEDFTATAENHMSLLRWSTASETDNDHFDIERSANAIDWTKIGSKKGAGTTSAQTDYTMVDVAPLSDANYYRLKQVDVDGQFVYTDIREVTFDNLQENKLSMYPNPVSIHAPFTIQLSKSISLIRHITITNTVGEIMYQNADQQTDLAQINDGTLAAGLYIVSVYGEDPKPVNSLLVVR